MAQIAEVTSEGWVITDLLAFRTLVNKTRPARESSGIKSIRTFGSR
jgi:hypothetical protein